MDDLPAEVITPDGIIRAYGHTITYIYQICLSINMRGTELLRDIYELLIG